METLRWWYDACYALVTARDRREAAALARVPVQAVRGPYRTYHEAVRAQARRTERQHGA